MKHTLGILIIFLLFCGNAFGSETLLQQYNKIKEINCVPDHEVDRNVTWGCYANKTKKWENLESILDNKIKSVLKESRTDDKSYLKTVKAWHHYQKTMDDLSYDYFNSGSSGTDFRLEAREHLAEQRVDYLIYLLTHFYVIDGVE